MAAASPVAPRGLLKRLCTCVVLMLANIFPFYHSRPNLLFFARTLRLLVLSFSPASEATAVFGAERAVWRQDIKKDRHSPGQLRA